MIVGLVPQSAHALAGAGISCLPDLADATWEQLRSIPGVGPRALAVLEEVLDRPLPRRTKPRNATPKKGRAWPEDIWRKRGLPGSAALTFALENMTLDRLRSSSREDLLALPGVGAGALAICELMIGHELPPRRST